MSINFVHNICKTFSVRLGFERTQFDFGEKLKIPFGQKEIKRNQRNEKRKIQVSF